MPLPRKGQRARTPATLKALAPGVTLSTLSKQTGIAKPHLSRVFSRQRGLTVSVALRIALAIGTTVDRVISHLHVNGHNQHHNARKKAA